MMIDATPSPRAYLSASTSYMRDRSVGERRFILLSAIYIPAPLLGEMLQIKSYG